MNKNEKGRSLWWKCMNSVGWVKKMEKRKKKVFFGFIGFIYKIWNWWYNVDIK